MGRATAAIVYVPERDALHGDWDEVLNEGLWEIKTRPDGVMDTGLSHIFSVPNMTGDELRFFFENPEELLYCLKWYFTESPKHHFRAGMMHALLNAR